MMVAKISFFHHTFPKDDIVEFTISLSTDKYQAINITAPGGGPNITTPSGGPIQAVAKRGDGLDKRNRFGNS